MTFCLAFARSLVYCQHMVKTTVLQFRLTAEQTAGYREAARAAGLMLSQWIREMLDRAAMHGASVAVKPAEPAPAPTNAPVHLLRSRRRMKEKLDAESFALLSPSERLRALRERRYQPAAGRA